jgi:hypothetical protein
LRKIKEKREVLGPGHGHGGEECVKAGKCVKKMQTLISYLLPCGNNVPE